MPAQDLSASGGQFPTNNSPIVGAVQPQASSPQDTVDELLKRQETIAQKVTTAPNVGPPIGKIDEQGAQTAKPQEPSKPIIPTDKPKPKEPAGAEPKLFINQEPVKLDEMPKVQEPVQPPTKPAEPVQIVKTTKPTEPPKKNTNRSPHSLPRCGSCR